MDLNREPHQIARAAAEEIRALNHATLDPKKMPYAHDVASAAEGINALLQRLPQALQQLQQALQGMGDRGEVRIDSLGEALDPTVAVNTACRALEDAQVRIQSAGSSMQSAVNQMGRMAGRVPAGEGEGCRA